ncbi:MAG: VOC family protein [Oceanicaulis sp.]
MSATLGRVIVYTGRIDELAAFYATHFGFDVIRRDGDRIVELRHRGGGAAILLHPLAKGRKDGPSLVKLVFDVEDVAGFRDAAAQGGLEFGPLHDGGGYVFANAKDPAGNTISISGRAFAHGGTPA